MNDSNSFRTFAPEEDDINSKMPFWKKFMIAALTTLSVAGSLVGLGYKLGTDHHEKADKEVANTYKELYDITDRFKNEDLKKFMLSVEYLYIFNESNIKNDRRANLAKEYIEENIYIFKDFVKDTIINNLENFTENNFTYDPNINSFTYKGKKINVPEEFEKIFKLINNQNIDVGIINALKEAISLLEKIENNQYIVVNNGIEIFLAKIEDPNNNSKSSFYDFPVLPTEPDKPTEPTK